MSPGVINHNLKFLTDEDCILCTISYGWFEVIIRIGVDSGVVCSTIKGNARAMFVE